MSLKSTGDSSSHRELDLWVAFELLQFAYIFLCVFYSFSDAFPPLSSTIKRSDCIAAHANRSHTRRVSARNGFAKVVNYWEDELFCLWITKHCSLRQSLDENLKIRKAHVLFPNSNLIKCNDLVSCTPKELLRIVLHCLNMSSRKLYVDHYSKSYLVENPDNYKWK